MYRDKVDPIITTEELIQDLCNADKESYVFSDIINLKNGLNRYLYINDVTAETGDTLSNYIGFYNDWDEENEIPVEERTPIRIYINSNGGDLIGAFSAIDTIKNSVTPVYTYNLGAAYSAGFFILIAGHKRFGNKHSSYLFHEGSAGSSGDAHKFRNFTAFYERQLDQLKEHVLDNTNISEELYKEKQKDDWWFDSEEALELGVIDEVI